MNLNYIISVFLKKNNKGKVARNTVYLFTSEVILKFLGVLWIVFLARTLSISNFGVYNIVTSFIAIFSFLPDFGIGLIIIREIAADRKKISKLLGSALILNSSLAVVTFIISVLTAIFLNYSNEIIILITISALTLIISTIRSVAIFYFDGTEKMQFSAYLNTLNSILLLLLGTVLFLYIKTVYSVFIGMLVGTMISFLISYSFLFKRTKISLLTSIKFLRAILSQSWPLGLAAFASLVYSRIDIIILSKLVGDAAAGIYGAAFPFPQALIQLGNVPFMVALFPTLTKLYKVNKKRFKSAFIKSLITVIVWSVPSALFISLTAPIFINLIFGDKYNAAIPVLQILIFIVPFASIWALMYKILIIMHRQKDYLFISIIGAAVNIFLNFQLIPQFGVLGAAYAALLTQVFLVIIYSVDLYLKLKINR